MTGEIDVHRETKECLANPAYGLAHLTYCLRGLWPRLQQRLRMRTSPFHTKKE